MEISYYDRAEMMMPGGSVEDIEEYAAQVEQWVDRQSDIITRMGRASLTRAVASLTRQPYGARLECMFYSERGNAFLVELLGDGGRAFGEIGTASVHDAAAAHSALAALLDELRMPAVLG